MKIRELMLLAGVSLALILFLSLSYFEFSVTRGNLEKSLEVMAEQKEIAFKKMLELSTRELETLCRDWAFWDDTYEFIESKSEDYVRSNLVFETFVNARINLMVFLDRNGEVVFAKFYDSEWNEMEISPIFTLRELFGRSGYLLLNGSLLILASEQIKRSDGSGEPKGYILMGRILDQDEIGEIGDVLGLKAELVPIAGGREFGEKLVSYLELEDLTGNKAFLRIEQENPLYSFYLNNLLFTIGFFGLISFLMMIASVFVVDRQIVSKIEKLEEFAKKAKTKDRIELEGTEEIESLARSMNSMLERIEKDEEELKFLLRVLRHDLMNALTSVKGFLELYRVENEPEFLEKAEKSLERGIDIIKVVKQLEAGEMKEFEIRSVVEELSSNYSIDAEIRGDARVLADEGIHTLFGNLIQNAIEHGKATKIFVEIDRTEGIVVRFSDNGTGFKEEARAKVFKEGYSEKGSGLGLFIVKKLMEKYGGSVEFQGKNTIVLRFPAPRIEMPFPEDSLDSSSNLLNPGE